MKKSISIKNLMGGVAAVTLCAFLAGCGGGGGGSTAAFDSEAPVSESFSFGKAYVSGLTEANITDQIERVATATGINVTVNGAGGQIIQTTGDVTNLTADVGNYAGGNITLNLHTPQTGEAFVINLDSPTDMGGGIYYPSLFYDNEVLLHRGTAAGNDTKFVLADIYYAGEDEGTADTADDSFIAGGFWFVINLPGSSGTATDDITYSQVAGGDIVDIGVFFNNTPLREMHYNSGRINSSDSNVVYSGNFASYSATNSGDTYNGADIAFDSYGNVLFTVDFSHASGGELTGEFTDIVSGDGSGANINLALGSTTWDTMNRAFIGTDNISCTPANSTVNSCTVSGSTFNGIFGGGGTIGADNLPNYFSGTFGLDGLIINWSEGSVNAVDMIGIFDSLKL